MLTEPSLFSVNVAVPTRLPAVFCNCALAVRPFVFRAVVPLIVFVSLIVLVMVNVSVALGVSTAVAVSVIMGVKVTADVAVPVIVSVALGVSVTLSVPVTPGVSVMLAVSVTLGVAVEEPRGVGVNTTTLQAESRQASKLSTNKVRRIP